MAEDPEIARRNRRTKRRIEEIVSDMEQHKREVLRQLRSTSIQRRLTDSVVRSICRRRTWYLTYKHSQMQQRFLAMMIPLAIIAHPNAKEVAREIGQYYSDNYVYEWSRSIFSRPLRMVARDMILRGADSSFGSTPQAGHLGYVMTHYEELHIENVSRYSELYTRTLGLQRENFFRDRHAERRQRLELDIHLNRAINTLHEDAAVSEEYD